MELVAAGDGYFRLQTLFLEPENKCLEGNSIAEDAVLGGASFMDDCSEAVGQRWRIIDFGDGNYRLVTAFLEPNGYCLAGSTGPNPDAPFGGAAFQDLLRRRPRTDLAHRSGRLTAGWSYVARAGSWMSSPGMIVWLWSAQPLTATIAATVVPVRRAIALNESLLSIV